MVPEKIFLRLRLRWLPQKQVLVMPLKRELMKQQQDQIEFFLAL
jgi:hypothetical protein